MGQLNEGIEEPIDAKHGNGVLVDQDSDNSPVPARRGLEPPPYVKSLTPEQRASAELRLRRKIDTRLLPMIILMYSECRCYALVNRKRKLMSSVMNYLDRNNIATARLAGLQDELGLSSTQYQVCWL